jgi:hypothetical protein
LDTDKDFAYYFDPNFATMLTSKFIMKCKEASTQNTRVHTLPVTAPSQRLSPSPGIPIMLETAHITSKPHSSEKATSPRDILKVEPARDDRRRSPMHHKKAFNLPPRTISNQPNISGADIDFLEYLPLKQLCVEEAQDMPRTSFFNHINRPHKELPKGKNDQGM